MYGLREPNSDSAALKAIAQATPDVSKQRLQKECVVDLQCFYPALDFLNEIFVHDHPPTSVILRHRTAKVKQAQMRAVGRASAYGSVGREMTLRSITHRWGLELPLQQHDSALDGDHRPAPSEQ